MRLFNCVLKRKSDRIPKGTNVEILSSKTPSKSDIKEAIERKYGITVSENDISLINWDCTEKK